MGGGRRRSLAVARWWPRLIWVLSLPFEIRYRLAWDGELVSAVLAVFLRVVEGWYRRRGKRRSQADGRSGAVTFVQRFGCANDAACSRKAPPTACGKKSPC